MVTCVFTLEGRERGGLGPEAGEKVVPRKSTNGCPVRLKLKRAEEEVLTLSVLVDMQLH